MHEWLDSVCILGNIGEITEFSYSYNLLGSLHEKIKKNEEANAMIQEAVWNWNGWVEAGQMHEWQTGQGSSLDLKQFSYGLADAWVTDSVCI